MNVNKKLDRFKQWAGERMGGEVKTGVSDDFRQLETEMGLRHEGMEKMHKSMNFYVKAMAKRIDGEDKEKNLPVGYVGRVMITHGQEFENNAEFGQCLGKCGHTHEKLARIQETFVANASSTWLESLDRSLAQMKEYQNARKKLETRRLAYDTSLTKLERQKKEDFRVEEELRNARAKFEETTDDVYRRMEEIKDTEGESVNDLHAFVEAELSYHEKCHEALLQLKLDWPGRKDSPTRKLSVNPRSRANTATQSLYPKRFAAAEDLSPPPSPEPEVRPSIKSTRSVSSQVTPVSRADPNPGTGYPRPMLGRSTTFEAGSTRSDTSPAFHPQRLHRLPSESAAIRSPQSHLRAIQPPPSERTLFDDPEESICTDSSLDRSYRDASPATSNASSLGGAKVKGPPPPPPSRAKKPPPPPPPAKRILMT